MASWIVHLRIADQLLDRIPDLRSTEFVVGNIAPDSGMKRIVRIRIGTLFILSHIVGRGGDKGGQRERRARRRRRHDGGAHP